MAPRTTVSAALVVFGCAVSACGGGGDGNSAGLTAGAAPSGAAGAASNVTGGVPNTTGGVPNTTGGVPNTTGGVPNTTGGAAAEAGSAATTAGTDSGGTPFGGAASGGAGGAGGTSGGVGGANDTAGPDIKAVMYLPNWAGKFSTWATKLDFSKMTHLDLAFGVIKNQTDWSLGATDDDVKAIAAAAHAKGTKVLVSIGGADDDIGISDAYANAANIEPMVNNLDALITRLTLDGVDVDLERGKFLKANTNFPQFLSALIAKERPQGRVVSCALAQYIVEDTGDDVNTTKAWLDTYDFINLMIYNPNVGTYTKELDWWTNQRKIDKKKLTWGVDFSSKTSVDYAKQLTTASKGYGGIMAWELSQTTAPPLWKAIQDTL